MTLRWKTLLSALGFLLSIEPGLTADDSKSAWGAKPSAKIFEAPNKTPNPEKSKLPEVEKEKAKEPCTAPLVTNEEAEACLKHQFATEHKTLYNFAHHAGHLGNVNDCSHSAGMGKKSYFSADEKLFAEVLVGSIDNIKCGPHRDNPNAYFCEGTFNSSKTLACKQGKATNKVGCAIGKKPTNILTFFPK